MQRLAIAAAAEIVREWVATEEPNQAVQLSDPVLERRSGKAPSVASFQFKGSLRSAGRTFLDVVSLIKLLNSISQVRRSVR